MSSLIKSDTAIFTFSNDLNNDNIEKLEFCKLLIDVKELQYENKERFYDISYSYSYSSNNQAAFSCNPLYGFINLKKDENLLSIDKEGVIVKKNNLTDELIKFLLMDSEILQKKSGNTNWQDYKIKIMISLSLLWD